MKKDIHIPKVKDVAIAVVEDGEDWIAYLINMNNFPIENTLVSSKGYGSLNNKKRKQHHSAITWELSKRRVTKKWNT